MVTIDGQQIKELATVVIDTRAFRISGLPTAEKDLEPAGIIREEEIPELIQKLRELQTNQYHVESENHNTGFWCLKYIILYRVGQNEFMVYDRYYKPIKDWKNL